MGKRYLGIGNGNGDGYGYGYGNGYGDGNGNGDGDGNGHGNGDGYGNGNGNGDGYGDGYGNGNGNGDGYGNGYGDGDGEVVIDPETPIIAWHFVPIDGKIRYPHGRQRPSVEIGLVLEYEGDLSLCSKGLHASLEKADAEKYCSGIATRVACSGRVKFGGDKLVCQRREVLEVFDADDSGAD